MHNSESQYNSNIFLKRKDRESLGVFTSSNIKKGDIIENIPYYMIDNEPVNFVNYSIFLESKSKWVILLGFGSYYKVDYQNPNSKLDSIDNLSIINGKDQFVNLRSLREIDEDEEIIICPSSFNIKIPDISKYHKNIYVSESKIAGRGVFANIDFCKDDIIEIVPFLIDRNIKKSTTGFNDLIIMNDIYPGGIMLMGYGSLYNHSDEYNAFYQYYSNSENEYSPLSNFMNFIAQKDIKAGSEITINYGKGWFEERKVKKD